MKKKVYLKKKLLKLQFLKETKRNKKIGDGDKIVAAAYGGLEFNAIQQITKVNNNKKKQKKKKGRKNANKN